MSGLTLDAMKLSRVAAITSTVRRFAQDEAGIRNALTRIRGIGYQAVQISGMGPMDEDELLRICNDLGLTICATHEPASTIVDHPEAVVARLRKLGVDQVANPFPNPQPTTPEALEELCRKLDHAGSVLRKAGITLSYHNHDLEFMHVNGRTIYEQLYEKTDPAHLQAEPDTYWIQLGGGDVVHWCERLKDRLPILHMKDYGIKERKVPEIRPIGAGNLDWKRIIAAAEGSGCQWFVVEHDGGTFESLEESFCYIRDHLCDAE